ncbi:GreA/GreB family elongation factor [uncultured Brevundimonas sp.]|uniref:GreA/GreB family elongation factor n=1 Tax=uncultured Brevundimonas sp. TaxID=213418 RepID=UPI002621E250|nr:GreA/GreB family elongation factor [uncultured Brevundimonas sp.]
MSRPRTKAQPPPAITITERDFDALERLVGDLPGTGAAGLLQQEMDRAEVVADTDLPKGTVGLNRWVHFTDGGAQDVRRVCLVLPKDADIDTGKISVLSFVGAGLLGLREGETIDWPNPSGETRRLTVVMVEDLDLVETLQH